MAYHDWSEDDFDWHALNSACNFFSTNIPRYARLCLYTKEKYGTLRLECFGMGHRGIYGLLHPKAIYWNPKGPYYLKKPSKAMAKLGLMPHMCSIWYTLNQYSAAIAGFTKLSWLFWQYQRAVFNIVTVLAVKKWPHIQDEILDEPEFDDMLYGFVKRHLNYVSNWVSCK